MILRNLQLNGKDRRELHGKLFHGADRGAHASLTLSNISTSFDDDDETDDAACGRHRSKSPGAGSLNCDFLMETDPERDSIGESRIEELTIERCRLDLEGARVLGKALESSCSAVSGLRSLKMDGVVFSDGGCSLNESGLLLPILEGIASARGGSPEAIELRRVPLPAAPELRRRFFAALGRCKNLRSLRLVNCDVRTEDAPGLAEAIASLSDTLKSLDLSRNDVDGSGLKTLLEEGLRGHGSLERLILSHNPIGDDGAIHLSRFFSRASNHSTARAAATATTTDSNEHARTRISSLWLVDCDTWSAGCSALSEGLRDFDTLSELVVDGEWDNHLGAVLESLRTNVVLKQLWIVSTDHPCCGDDSGSDDEAPDHERILLREQIDYYLALNRAHRRVSVEPGLSFRLWPTVLAGPPGGGEGPPRGTPSKAAAANANLWYHLLQRRPELVAAAE
ncbi:unnamed protein product [Pseudo-nitzschia multistriata]|uniref:Uncharacterized protein n=1 Tax=Pseudo-nitzschia multistriata TaxID=183589 RepID=A0A448ZRY8_9STRA|nr:unnamed protein product [Pseudo-nitzschia multistriata]